MVKRIGVLTSGGDAPGMNAAIRAVTRVALNSGIEVFGIYDGYKGMVEGYIEPLTKASVGEIIDRGGTILGSARLPEFKDPEVRAKAVTQLKKRGIEAVVVIGGDGSYRGALALTEMGINCIGIPGTIDNDITCTDFTIGFDTALTTVVDAIDKLRDTSNSHHRCSIVEVMGNRCGDLALWAGISCGAEIVITSDTGFEESEVLERLRDLDLIKKKRHAIIVISEKITDVASVCQKSEPEHRLLRTRHHPGSYPARRRAYAERPHPGITHGRKGRGPVDAGHWRSVHQHYRESDRFCADRGGAGHAAHFPQAAAESV